jgi:hypothetical protein
MSWQFCVLMIVVGLAILGVTVSLIRRRRLRDEYAVLWVLTGLAILMLVLVPKVLTGAATALGMTGESDPAVLVMLMCFLFLSAVVMHYSVALTRQAEREKNLEQEIALMRDEILRLKSEVREVPPAPAEPRPKPPALRT